MRHSAPSVGYRLPQLAAGDAALHAVRDHAAAILARCRAAVVALARRGLAKRRPEDDYFELWLETRHRYPRAIAARAWRRHSGYLVQRAAFEGQQRERGRTAQESPVL
jgi:hypothetical protein